LFFQSFDFECQQRKSVEPQSVLFCDFFLVGVLTVEPKTLNHDLEESLFGFISTLLPTVAILFVISSIRHQFTEAKPLSNKPQNELVKLLSEVEMRDTIWAS
jgi:hypothetical protein